MAKLADLVKAFRANVREGNPCQMTFNGKIVTLLPIQVGKFNQEIWERTHCGLVMNPSKPKQS